MIVGSNSSMSWALRDGSIEKIAVTACMLITSVSRGVPWHGTIVPRPRLLGPGRQIHAEHAGTDAESQVLSERFVFGAHASEHVPDPALDVDPRALGRGRRTAIPSSKANGP